LLRKEESGFFELSRFLSNFLEERWHKQIFNEKVETFNKGNERKKESF
jgi:hypothetical protein